MDLKSTNGTFINGERIEPYKYYEIREKDVVKFGHSTRDYVFLTEESVKGTSGSQSNSGPREDIAEDD